MQLDEFKKIRVEIAKSIKNIFGERSKSIEVFDVVEEPGHWAFKIKFISYDYLFVLFNYELDIIGFSVDVGSGKFVSLSNDKHCYSGTDMNNFIKEIRRELELRIPDKYLISKGWL